MRFELVRPVGIDDRGGAGRAGVISTAHGNVETPAFLPCGTIGAVKAVRWAELEALDYRLVLMNALHLYLRPGLDALRCRLQPESSEVRCRLQPESSEVGGVWAYGGVKGGGAVKHLSGIHEFSGWKRAILTDSGGYQFFSLKGLYDIDDDGVSFQSPHDGSSHRFTPEGVIELQVALGSDIIMPLDECAPGDAERKHVEIAAERTLNWLERANARFKEIRCRLQAESSELGGVALFGIVQGGVHLDLRREYLDRTVALDLPGYALGGISVGEDRAEGEEVVREIAPLLPEDKPRYLMGVGLPEQIIDAIAAGIDMFDCVLPTRMGRNGTVFTSRGRLNLGNERFKTDSAPLDLDCSCPTCQSHSRAYLAHLHRVHEPGVLGLLSLHNLAYYRKLVREAREAILADRFAVWRRETEEAWASSV